jgi:hypothetical protein
MTLLYRGADYEVAQPTQLQQSRSSVTLTYRGNRYQSHQYQPMTQGIGNQRSITNQLPHSSRRAITANLRLVYRGIAYTL